MKQQDGFTKRSGRRAAILQPLRRLVGRAKRDNRGGAAAEFALISPILIMIVIATADLGFAIHASMQVNSAAQAGAYHASRRGFDEGSITKAVTNASAYLNVVAQPAPTKFCGCASSTGITTASCNSPCTTGTNAGTYVTVSSQATHTTIIPYPLIPKSFTFTSQSTVRIP